MCITVVLEWGITSGTLSPFTAEREGLCFRRTFPDVLACRPHPRIILDWQLYPRHNRTNNESNTIQVGKGSGSIRN
jgi:hypothetical protein